MTNGERYGSRSTVVGAAGAFGALVVLAACTVLTTADLMSNACIGDAGQMMCPTSRPDWFRPLPGAVTLLGLVAGLTGVLAGRPLRRPALIAGYLLVTAAMIAGGLFG